jgi:hypothetical protein
MQSQLHHVIRYRIVADCITQPFRNRVVVAASILSFAASVTVSAQIFKETELWKKCTTTTTDYILEVPASLVPAQQPGVADCVYRSEDGEFNVEAAEQVDAQTLDAKMQKELDLLKGTVTDQKKGDNWFALTGVSADGTEFYRLHYTNGSQWVSLRMTFPHSKAKKYDDWVDRIDKEFVPFAKGEEKPAEEKATTTKKPAAVTKPAESPTKVPPH